MRFDFDDEQREIKDTARQFLATRFKPEKVRELAEAGTYDDSLWSEISELGWAGIAIDEEHGGQGLGMVDQPPWWRTCSPAGPRPGTSR